METKNFNASSAWNVKAQLSENEEVMFLANENIPLKLRQRYIRRYGVQDEGCLYNNLELLKVYLQTSVPSETMFNILMDTESVDLLEALLSGGELKTRDDSEERFVAEELRLLREFPELFVRYSWYNVPAKATREAALATLPTELLAQACNLWLDISVATTSLADIMPKELKKMA